MTPSPMSKDICCQNFKGLTAYILRHYGDSGFEKLTSGLLNGRYFVQDKYQPAVLIPINKGHLIDPAYWVSNEFSLQMLHNVSHVVAGKHPLLTAGRDMVKENLSATSLFFTKIIGLKRVAGQVAKINRRFNKTKDVRLTELRDDFVRFELNYHPGFTVTKDVCEWNLGIYMGIAELAGQTQVEGKETACILNGDKHCCFEIRWQRQHFLSRIRKVFFTSVQRWLLKDLTAEYESIIDERDQLILNLEKSERKYRTLFEESQEALCLSQNGNIIDVNPSWIKLHGYSDKDKVLGNAVTTYVHPDDRRILADMSINCPDKNERMIELRHVTQVGHVLDVEVYSSHIEYEGDNSILAMVKDVTEQKRTREKRKELEARVIRAEKMETIATLAGGVAHDLNNILSGIVGYPELIMMQLPKDSTLRKSVQMMHLSALKAAEIVQDLLTLSRRDTISKEVINLNPIVNEYMNSLEYQKLLHENRNISVKINLETDLSNMRGSPIHISKVLMNLVTNAVEAMPQGGVMHVKTKNSYIDRQLHAYDNIEEGEYCVLSVVDTGVGISKADQNKIFEPFFTKKKLGRSGTGLGMAVVWGSVKDHRGYINIDSEIGKGTVIRVYFPATRDRISENVLHNDLAMFKGNGEKILIIDDVKEQLCIAKEILSMLNYRTVTVESGEAAVEYLKKNRCDLIMLDMIMEPGMDGLETYKEIIKIRPHQKAIVASGYSENDRVKETQRHGAGAYLKKPYTIDKLGLAVKTELAKGAKKAPP